MDRIELPENWRIDGDFIVHTIGTRVQVRAGDLCIEFDDERSCASLELSIVHAAVKLAEVTEIIEQERKRLMAERFAGRA